MRFKAANTSISSGKEKEKGGGKLEALKFWGRGGGGKMNHIGVTLSAS